MLLATGKHIYCFVWKELPISEDMIDRVHQLALDDEQPLVSTNFKFNWRIGCDEIGGGEWGKRYRNE